MPSIKDNILSEFRRVFNNMKNKRIVLYGTGENADVILNNNSDYNFIGVMDGFKTSGTFCGYDILDYEEALNRKVEVIIIVARPNSTNVIIRRISDFCLKNNIKVFNLAGNDLLIVENIIEHNEYFSKNEDELKKLIEKNEVIFFDILDTLITGYMCEFNDVFNIIDNNFEKLKSFLTLREKMYDIFQYAINKDKEVYLINNTSLSRDVLIDILNTFKIFGYINIIDKLPNEIPSTFKSKLCLYIGIDDQNEINYNDVYLIKSPFEMLNISVYKDINEKGKTLNEKIMLGFFVAKAFNNPFILYKSSGKLSINSVYDRGYLFIAPLITTFMIWFIDKIKERNFDVILFAARDGFLISKLYEITKDILNIELPEGSYFLISRLIAGIVAATDEEDIKYFSSYPFQGEPKDMLKKRFLLEDVDILEYTSEEKIEEYVMKHKEQIIRKANNIKEKYLEYIRSIGILGKNKIGFFDFVSSGTSQMVLDKLLGIRTSGFYFIHVLSDYLRKQNLNIKTPYKKGNLFEIKNYLYNNYVFLEYILASDKPSIHYFDDNKNPVYLEESRSNEEIRSIKFIQKSIMDYYSLYLSKVVKFDDISIEFADKLFGYMDDKYTIFNDEFSSKIVLENEFYNKSFIFNESKEE